MNFSNIKLNSKHIIISILGLCILIIEIIGGGSPIISCAVSEAMPFSGMGSQECAQKVGDKALILAACNLITNSQGKDMCQGAYAVAHNEPQLCEQISNQLMTGRILCAQGLAIKNRDPKFCNMVSSNTFNDTEEFLKNDCLSYVRSNLFGGEMCPDDSRFWYYGEQICKARKNIAMSVCSNKIGEEQLDCYLETAIQQKNPELCFSVSEKNGYGQSDYRLYDCLFQVSQKTNDVNTCNLIPQESGSGILPRAGCYQKVLGLQDSEIIESTNACNLISDLNNKNICHALFAHLSAYLSFAGQPSSQYPLILNSIRKQAINKCSPITDTTLNQWCRNDLSNYTVGIELSNFPK